jgi:hypothetical protein
VFSGLATVHRPTSISTSLAGGRSRLVIVEREEVGLPTITDKEIEAEARAMLRETIDRSGWYPTLRREERERLI